jgi:hypothetical protein
VKDLAVVLALCDEHADQLTRAAWAATLDLLTRWGWRPLTATWQRLAETQTTESQEPPAAHD